MRKTFLMSAALLLVASFPWQARAATFNFGFAGPGVNGSVILTYGTATDAKYPQGFEVTGVSGIFSDTNNNLNIVNAPITGIQALNRAAPEPTNLLAPADFSHFTVATGLPAEGGGFLSYDNLFYPGGSPPTATDYQVHGGFLDIYGLLFTVNNGPVVNVWSNGDFTGTGNGPISYGVAVVTPAAALDYVSGGVSITPEPAAWGLFGTGLLGLLVWTRVRRSQAN